MSLGALRPARGGAQFQARPHGVALGPWYPRAAVPGARAAHSSPSGGGAQTMRGAALARARARAAVGTKDAR